jgi:hypothetical protein
MKKWWFVAGAFASVSAAGYWGYVEGKSSAVLSGTERARADAPPRTAPLQHRRASSATTADLVQRQSPAVVRLAPADPPSRSPPAETLPVAELTNETDAESIERQRVEVESRFEGDFRDGKGRDVERTIDVAASSAAGSNGRVKAIDCRSSICRLSVEIAGRDAQSAFAESLAGQPALATMEKMYSYSADGRSMSIYLAREGRSLLQ